jgi:predicted TIM-barrel fold metal-dependent hydrolase
MHPSVELKKVELAALRPEERELVLWKNITRLMHLPVTGA